MTVASVAMMSIPAPAAPVPAPESPPSVLRQVIPAPTGQNGYEELVAAIDALRISTRYATVERAAPGSADATLDKKRRALRDPPVIRALELLRRGLSKPVVSPRSSLSVETLFPEFAGLRSLARLLVMQQYVLLADGRVPEAIESVRLGLRFSTVIQTDTLISGLVGIACSSITIRGALGGHLEQLSARDCERLYRVCMEWLREPDPYSRMMEAERKGGKQVLSEVREGKVDPISVFGLSPGGGEPVSDEEAATRRAMEELKRLRTSSPERYARDFLRAERQFDRFFDQIAEESRKPAWQRAAVAQPEGDGPIGHLLHLLLPALDKVGDRYTQVQASVRLLACHAAILRYRWEQDRLPATLAVLNLGELAIDPFTGQTLKYAVKGPRYSLTSVGAPAAADDPRAVDGRRPVSVVPGE